MGLNCRACEEDWQTDMFPFQMVMARGEADVVSTETAGDVCPIVKDQPKHGQKRKEIIYLLKSYNSTGQQMKNIFKPLFQLENLNRANVCVCVSVCVFAGGSENNFSC